MKKIGIVVENYYKIPHETEQINAQIMKQEIKTLGGSAVIFYFNGDVGGEKATSFGNFFNSNVSEVYLSGKLKNRDFFKLVLFCFLKRRKIHFRIPSYNLKLFKTYRLFLKILMGIGVLKLYSYDSVHREYIKKELGFETEILEPLVNLKPLEKRPKKNEFDILFIGSYNDLKRGLKELLEAVAIIKKNKPAIKLKIISRYEIYTKKKDWFSGFRGKRTDIVSEIKSTVKEYGLEKNIIFSGKVEDLSKEYAKAKVYVLPILEFDKMPPIPFTILESLYYGTPVIASNFWGIPLILNEKYLINKDLEKRKFSRELANKIMKVLKEKPKVSLDKKFYSKEATKKFLGFVDED